MIDIVCNNSNMHCTVVKPMHMMYPPSKWKEVKIQNLHGEIYHEPFNNYMKLVSMSRTDNSLHEKMVHYFSEPEKLISFSYKFNDYGFRSDRQFLLAGDEPTVWVFGDSLTLGDCVPNGYEWPAVLDTMIVPNVYNFSKAGSGIDTAIRLLENWLKETNNPPTKILVYGYYRNRIEVYDSESNEYRNDYDSSISEDDHIDKCKKLKQIAGDIPIHIVDFMSNETHWYDLCEDFGHDISNKVYDIILNNDILNVTHSLNDQTISGLVPHPGIKSHKNIASMFFNKFFT